MALTRSGNQSIPAGAARAWMRLVLTAFYLVAGVLHLRLTNGFAAIVPAFVPEPHRVVLLTGWCEILGAAALQVRRLRRLAGIMLAIYAVCVFPANVNQAVNHIPVDGRVLGWGYHAIRFALEPVLIWWTLWCSAVIDWPFGSVPRRRH